MTRSKKKEFLGGSQFLRTSPLFAAMKFKNHIPVYTTKPTNAITCNGLRVDDCCIYPSFY